jgi:hypothetical protein
VLYHLEDLPLSAIHTVWGLHSVDDELSSFSQSVQLAEDLACRDHPNELYSHEGLKHYSSTSANNATGN